jgi:hypothetical protein
MPPVRSIAFLLSIMGSAYAQSPGTFSPTQNMNTRRALHTATLLHDGRVLIAGGSSGFLSPLASVELFDPTTGAFTPTGNMTVPREGFHTATRLPDGKVLIAGGTPYFGGGGALSSAELYDPETGTFASVNNMNVPRSGHSATLLRNGKVLIAGGASGTGFHASSELYDPEAGTFTSTGDMTTARGGHRAILLASGRVLIVPDSDAIGYDSAELYDPDGGTFQSTGWVSRTFGGSVAHTANLLLNGNVLVTLAPGDCTWTGADAQFYDPSTETFAPTGSMVTRRCYQAGTSLSDGTVLMSGNWPCTDQPIAEIYDLRSGSFVLSGRMATSRQGHTATLLTDGRVLIAGGSEATLRSCGKGITDAAELYTPRLAAPTPVLLSLSGTSQGAILHASTHQIVSTDSPATGGEVLEMYATGLIDGSVVPPQVAIGGRVAEVLYFGSAPGFPGLNQINVRVPPGVARGSSIPIRMSYFDRPSKAVTLAVQ